MLKPLKKLALSSIAVSMLLSTQLSADYYVMINGNREGPISVEKISEMAQSGSVNKNSLVWQSNMAGWAKASSQAELQNIFSAPPPPPPPSEGTMPPPPPSSAPQSATSNDINEQNTMSDANLVPEPTAAESAEDWGDSVLQKLGVDSFGVNNGKYFLFAQQTVSLKPIDPQYGDAVVNAFDKAMMKIQEQYVLDLFGNTVVDKVKSFYSNRSTDAKTLDLPPSQDPGFLGKVLKVLDKQLDLMGKKLDSKLIKEGIDPEMLATATPTVKKDLFRDKFLKTTMQKASGSMAGLVPIQTTLIRDSKGNTVIGIVAVASDKTKQIAKDISLRRKSNVRGRGRDITSLLPKSSKEFLGTMGVRLVYDLDGSPAIVSYGIASYRPDDADDYINSELREEAKAAAKSNADGQIAEMVNGRLNVKNERKTGEETRKYIEREVKLGSSIDEHTVKNMIKITNKNAKSSAKMKTAGISTIKTWRFNSKKTGLKFVGAVRVWKYSTLNAVKSFKNPKKKISAKKKKTAYKTFQTESSSVNSMDDF